MTDPYNSSPPISVRSLILGDNTVTTALELPGCRVDWTPDMIRGYIDDQLVLELPNEGKGP